MIHLALIALALIAPQTATAPSTPGTVMITGEYVNLDTDGCLAFVNNRGNHPKCGFNIVLSGLALPGIVCTAKVSGADTILDCTYPPVVPFDCANPATRAIAKKCAKLQGAP